MGALYTAANQRYSAAISLAMLDVTVTAWIRRNSDRGTFSVPFNLDLTASSHYFVFGTDGTGDVLYAEISIFAGTDVAIPGPTLVNGTWVFVAFRRSGTGANSGTFYWGADGSALSSASATFTETFTATTLMVGTHALDTTEFFDGSAAHVKVWSSGLSQGEIENERYTSVPQRTTNLFAWYPLLEGGSTAGSLQDFSGNGRTLTNPGGANPATTDNPPVSWSMGRRRVLIPDFVRRWILKR